MEIENFKLIEFLDKSPELIKEYLVALQYIKPKQTKREIIHMKLKHVEFIKNEINSNNDFDLIKIVSKVQKCTKEEVLEIQIIEFFGILNSIKEQLNQIIKAEENALNSSEVDFKFEMVNGSERMSKFGIYNTLEHLSGGDPTKYKYLLNMPYSEIFTILLMKKTALDIQQEINKIKD